MSILMQVMAAKSAIERLRQTDPEISRAYAYADAAHSACGQVRKFTNEPYITHPALVAGLLIGCRTITSATDMRWTLQAALLHDVIEDTMVTSEDMAREFDDEVVSLVEELSEPDDDAYWLSLGFDERPPRPFRRDIEVKRRATISTLAQTISCADTIANSYNIVDAAPAKFAAMYQQELYNRVSVLNAADPALRRDAGLLIAANLTRLSVDA